LTIGYSGSLGVRCRYQWKDLLSEATFLANHHRRITSTLSIKFGNLALALRGKFSKKTVLLKDYKENIESAINYTLKINDIPILLRANVGNEVIGLFGGIRLNDIGLGVAVSKKPHGTHYGFFIDF